ncbi:hypothetical protein CAPTEDRAFT_228144 [Capitella teleta]|uniref:Uncharacterized protein n=1 Tax=Capitella teleta TaxID=283909 RepID=R7UP53_CAPTE|nr:hypothetical protein CAPTEDRAFT_228144 [Capitella teleta]|eukprot:ELU05171.1 hypothetical protein CAPTEDRAFT_228144 [Capitella teleta]
MASALGPLEPHTLVVCDYAKIHKNVLKMYVKWSMVASVYVDPTDKKRHRSQQSQENNQETHSNHSRSSVDSTESENNTIPKAEQIQGHPPLPTPPHINGDLRHMEIEVNSFLETKVKPMRGIAVPGKSQSISDRDSLQEFFRVLDEKINQGRDYLSDEDT